MRRIGVREFRDHATQYLASDEVLAIERHGQPIGFYIPTGASQQESFVQALERLEQSVKRVMAESGLSEEELSRLYDLNEPVPERPGVGPHSGTQAGARWGAPVRDRAQYIAPLQRPAPS